METIKHHSLYKDHDFDTAFGALYQIYRKNFFPLFLISLVGIVVFYLSFLLLGWHQLDMASLVEEGPEHPARLVSFGFLILLIGLVLYTFVYLGITWFVYRKQGDEKVDPLKTFGEASRKYFFRYLLLMILVGVILVAGTMLGIFILVIGSLLALLYLGVSLFVSAPAMVIEDIDPGNAVGRSFVLTHKDFWVNLGLVIVFFLIVIIIQLILTAIISIPGAVIFISKVIASGDVSEWFTHDQMFSCFGLGTVGMVLNAVVNALVLPLTPIFSVILYYKLRCKEENKPSPTS